MRVSRLRAMVGAIVLLGGCSGSDITTNPGNNNNTGSFTMALSSNTLSLAQGANGTVTVNITRAGGFTGAVALSVTAPAGLTATVADANVTGNSTTMTLSAASTLAVGSQTVTVRANATGMSEQTATVTVNVTATQTQTGSFTFALSPTSLSIQQSANATSQITLTRTGNFTGDVALSATTPAGVTVTFNPSTLSGTTTTSTMTVAVASTVAAGAASVTVRANASGQTEKTAALNVTVTAAPGGGGNTGNTSWTFCGFSGIPLWMAVQDGGGAWNAITAGANNSYSFSINSGRGAVAYVTAASGGGFNTQIFYGTASEIQSQGSNICAGTTGAGKTITGTVAGINAPFDIGFVTLGQSQAQIQAGGTSFSLSGVLDGPLDLVAARVQGSFSGAGVNFTPASFVIQRNLNLANNTALPSINFASGITPSQATLTFANAGSDWTGSIGLFYTQRNTLGVLYTDLGIASNASRPWYGVPAGSQVMGDLHVINAIAVVPTQSAASQTRQAMFVTSTVANKTVTFGAALNAPTVTTVATSPYVRMRLDHTPQSDYSRYFTANFQQGTAGTFRSTTIQKTSGNVSAGGENRMEIPDFTGVTGWNNDWGLKSGALTTWTFTASGWSGSGVTSPFFVEGATLLSGTRTAQVTP